MKQDVNMHIYYMASSANGQDEPNHTMWLATQVGKMETTRCILCGVLQNLSF